MNFKSIPFLKILFPYIIGIICSLHFRPLQHLHLLFLSIAFVWVIAFIVQAQNTLKNNYTKTVYIIFTNILLFILAYEACFLYSAKNNHNHYSHFVDSHSQNFIVTISDIPVVTQNFIKLPVQVNCIEKSNTWHYTEGNTIIYLKKDSLLHLNIGNSILVNSKFSFVNEPKNPNEFNYKAFLESKNIFHTVYSKSKNIFIVSKTNSHDEILQLGVKIKSHLVSVLRNSNLSQQAFSICSALLVGYDDEIDSNVMQSFSHSGTLHILSVSGMHTGVLYGILMLVFSVFDKYDRYKKTKFCVVFISLIMFVLVTGLSPSVLRASLMLILVLFGKTFYKQGNSYNTLLLSAFLLLLYNPYLIIDVGFLLSYMAVFGIMYFYPLLNKIYIFENKLIQWLWTSVLISTAATLFTLPISLYFFHQFPIWFALSNLIIIPISMMIMLGAAIFLIIYKIAFINHLVVYVINSATTIMISLAKITDNPDYGFIDSIPFSEIDLVFMSLSIIFCFIIISNKQYKHVLMLFLTIVFWLSTSIYSNYNQQHQKELVVFHIKKKSVFAIRIGQTVYANFNTIDNKEFQRYVKPYLLTISNLNIISTQYNLFKYSNKTILNCNHPNYPIPNINPNYIVVSNDVPLNLTTNYKTKPTIIADCSNSYSFVKHLKKQCALLEIPLYWVKENGAVQITL